MTKPSKIFLILMIGSIGISVIVWKYWPLSFFTNTPVSAASSSHSADKTPSMSSALTHSSSLRMRPLDQPSTPAAKLARLYETSSDKRAFYDLALTQPENGGRFFASKILMQCMPWIGKDKTNAIWMKTRIANIPPDFQERDKVERALHRMHEPCIGFDSSPVAYATFKLGAADDIKDPIVTGIKKINAALNSPGTSEQLQATLSDIAGTKNAHAMYEALTILGAANSSNMVVLVDGQALSPEYWDAFLVALPAAACQLGVDCTDNAPGLTNQCARGKCFNDLGEYARAGLNPAQFEEYIRLRDLTSVAIATRDFSRFTVLRKPK